MTRASRRSLLRLAQEIMVIVPDNRYEQVAHRVAEPCGTEQQKCFKGWELRWPQVHNQHRNKDSEHVVGNVLSCSGVALRSMVAALSRMMSTPVLRK
jgi:hypothetical protein